MSTVSEQMASVLVRNAILNIPTGYLDAERRSQEANRQAAAVLTQVGEAKAVAPLSEEAIKEKLRVVIRHALAEGWGRGENGDGLAGTKDFIEKMVKACTEILAAPAGLGLAKQSDARYAQGYSDGWREGRENLKQEGSC